MTPAWMRHGICTYKKNPALWDGVRKHRGANAPLDFSAAKKVCDACPVSQLCAADAVANGLTGCMRGGKTPSELEALVKAREAALA